MSDEPERPAELSHLDVLQASKWDAALFTTYPLSLSFFEAAPLIKLRAGNCRQITVLVDIQGYASSLSERGATGAGRSFEVRPVLVKENGCFHPKVCLLIGKDGPRALVGSGNLTFTGWGRNLEFADYLCPQHAGSALRDLGGFLEQLPTSPKVTAEFGDLEQFIDACKRAPESGRTRVLHDLKQPLIDQLVEEVVNAGGARALKVVSPYFGSGDGLLGLASRLKVDDVGIFVCRQTREAFPEQQAKSAGLHIKRFGSQTLGDSERALHGKIVEVETKKGKRVLLSGSVNVTKTALIDSRNVELAVLRVVDGTTSHFGWVPSTLAVNASPGTFEGGTANPVVIAAFEDGVLNGRILWTERVAGQWGGAIEQGIRRHELSSRVEVDEVGSFKVRDEALAKLALLGGALQIELRHDDVIARGWILLSDFLAAIRQRGGLAEAVIRVIAGAGDVGDLEAILNFAANDPTAFVRAMGSSEAGSDDRELDNRLIDAAALAPRSVEDVGEAPAAGSLSAFDRLLLALRVKIGSGQHASGPDDDEDEGRDDNSGTDRKAPTRRVRGEFFKRFLDAFEKRIAGAANEADRRHDLETMLGFIRFFIDYVDDGEARRGELLDRWLHLAARHSRGASNAIDLLDVEFALGKCAHVLASSASATNTHGDLQRYWNGPTPPGLFERLREGVERGSARQWASFATERAWLNAIETILATTTQWQNAVTLLRAARAGELANAPPGFEAHEDLEDLRALVSDRDFRRLVEVNVRSKGNQVCPSCNIVMSAVASGELRRTRLARCSTPRCGRLVVDIAP